MPAGHFRNNIKCYFVSNVTAKSDFCTMCLGYNIPNPVLSGGLVLGNPSLEIKLIYAQTSNIYKGLHLDPF